MSITVTEPLPGPCPRCGTTADDGRLIVGWLPCDCPGARHGGHRSYECTVCGAITYRTRHTDHRRSAAYWHHPDPEVTTR